MEKGCFFSYSWNIQENETNRTIIRIYGINEKNENVCIIVNNFTPYVYIELPNTVEWDSTKAQLVVSKIDDILKERKPIIKQLMYKKRLYYSNTDDKNKKKLFPYLFCCFSHIEDIKQLSYKIRRPFNIPRIGILNLKIHEYNASPILQLTSLRKIPTAGWINFVGKRISKDEQITHCTHEYSVSWKNLEDKKSDTVARPLCMSFDLEVNSSIPSSMPKSGRPNDKIFQISCVIHRQGTKQDTYQKFLLSLGTADKDKLDSSIQLISFQTENDLLLGFTNLIQQHQPNIIMGYNIFGFDIPYMIDRAKLLYCIYDFDKMGMDKEGHAKEKSISWSSSAYKNQSFQFLDAEGRLFVDLLPLVKRDYKMSNYKLETIASHFLKGVTKDPLGPKGIFECYRLGMLGGKKGNKALSICGNYCVKDSFLVSRLFEVLTTWVALCEMSKVTNVPIFSLYTQGQQLKVFSQVYRKCTHENTVIEKDGYISKDDDHYVGATVFPPIPGVYDKVIPLDFSSLYPTTIIAYNLCWSTLVNDESVPDDLCHVMIWEDHQGCLHDPKVVRKTEINEILKKKDLELKQIRHERDLKKNKDKKQEFKLIIDNFNKKIKPLRDERTSLNKSKPKHIICCQRKFRWLKSPMGVLPEILTNLLDTRAATKKEMKSVKAKLKEMKDSGISEDDPTYHDLATYYDVLDQRQLALKVSANSGYGATGTQKGYLPCMPVAMCTTYMGRKAIEKAAHTVQKDHGGHLVYGDSVTPDTPILCRLDGLILYKTIDTISNGNWTSYHGDKEISNPLPGIEVWTEKGFTNIKQVIRHKCQKKIFTVMTPNGVVHVTEDHSLLDKNAEKITPKELKVGSEILVSHLPDITNNEHSIFTEYDAYLLGVNFKDRKNMLNIILNDTFKNRKAFMHGFFSVNLIYYCDTQKNLAPIYLIAKSIGYTVVINTTINPNLYRLTFSKPYNKEETSGKITRIEVYSDTYNDFVYDLETENHHFSAGVGQIIVHNTDSNYVSFPHLNTAAECWDHAVHVAKEISKLYPKPMSLAFEEKVYMRFMILTKKRYMSLACERDGKLDTKISKKGVLLQRRDTCDFVRKVYGEVVMMIFNKQDRDDILYYIIQELNKLCSASYPVTDFIVTKSVSNMGFYEDGDEDGDPELVESKNDKGKICWKIGDYTVKLLPTDPDKRASQFKLKNCNSIKDYYLHSFPAQAQLAYKMRSRGQLVAAGSRIEYVITLTGGHLAKQYLKVESSEYFIRHRSVLDIDYLYYLKQLTNPMDQVLDVMYDKDDNHQYRFSPHFMLQQYKYRYQIRQKMINELNSIFTPKITFN